MDRLVTLLLAYPELAISAWLSAHIIAALMIGIKSRTNLCIAITAVILAAVILPMSGVIAANGNF